MPGESTAAQVEFSFAPATKTADIVLSPGAETALRPSQAAFNKQIKRLRKIQAKLEEEKACRDQMHREYSEKVAPLLSGHALARFLWIEAGLACLDDKKLRLSARQHELFLDCLLDQMDTLWDTSFGLEHGRLQELQKRFDAILGEADEDDDDDDVEFDMAFEAMKSAADEMLRAHGLKMDFGDLDPDNPEEWEARIKAAVDAKEEARPRRQSAKQKAAAEAKEKKIREEEQAKLRDFKSLFKNLAKAMHPDLVTDAEAKAHREDWMKRLTAAYESKDLHAMLLIEMEWLGTESTDLAKASDEKLAMYTRLLREQCLELESELRQLAFADPLNNFSSPFRRDVPTIREVRKQVEREIELINQQAEIFQAGGKNCKKTISSILYRPGMFGDPWAELD